jgi:hypothetical protein
MTEIIPDDLPLNHLELTVRAANALRNDSEWRTHHGRPPILTAGDIRAIPDRELLRIPNFGRVSLLQVRELLGPHKPSDRPSLIPAVIAVLDETVRDIQTAITRLKNLENGPKL